MPIKGYNFAPSVFLSELLTQCNVATECDRRLRDAAPTWLHNATSEQLANQRAPRDIMSDCIAFLSSAAVISKMLFAGRRKSNSAVQRCKRLRELLTLEDDALPSLRKLAVGNSFEHNRRFDPRHLTISFLGETISLPDYMAEVEKVSDHLDQAFTKLAGPEFRLW